MIERMHVLAGARARVSARAHTHTILNLMCDLEKKRNIIHKNTEK